MTAGAAKRGKADIELNTNWGHGDMMQVSLEGAAFRKVNIESSLAPSKKLLFLAGPLTGLSYEEALAWRAEVERKLPSDIIAFSALRRKDYLSDETVLKDSYAARPLSTPRGTITRDRNDVMRCDALFVNLLGAKQVSLGTMFELAWADLRRIPIIIVMEPGNVHDHAFVREVAGYVAQSIDEGIDIAVSVLSHTVV